MALMQIKGLEKRYVGRNALCGVDMELAPGQIVGLLGPNGSGKTTLLKTMAGLLVPERGELVYPGGAARGRGAKSAVSFMPDRLVLPSWMKVRDAFRYYREVYPDYDQHKADYLMGLLELKPDELLRRMSKGMQERVALALTFSRSAAVYLLDEPLGGIDPVGKMRVLESILSMDLKESVILLSTHLVKDVEAIFDSIYLISHGKIVFTGNCEEIRAQSGKTVEQVYLEVFSNVQSV